MKGSKIPTLPQRTRQGWGTPFFKSHDNLLCVIRARNENWFMNYFAGTISKMISILSLTRTVPPAIFTGVMPKSVCLSVASPL